MQTPIEHLHSSLNNYHRLSDAGWQAYLACCKVKRVNKGEVLYSVGSKPLSFSFIHKGLMRAYVVDEAGNEYNKNFFAEGRFPGCMSALLNDEPSHLGVEALEHCEIIEINHHQFRQVLFEHNDLMRLHICYLERHWLLEKEPKEISYLQFDAKARYAKFLSDNKDILSRLPQYHIASYLGITPTQLSRIKKS
ncbi:Crp/Fnr family transcriptional regulator [Shewanella woodyi]|uniref:Crp/Fnr family transcriptional regulator n=1 Tax=Shewanella woodyi TaxID=60961 RepID=UPI0007F93EE4|nr:Crp/Fnr family transcriptional regulator [Shewanella woodyi]